MLLSLDSVHALPQRQAFGSFRTPVYTRIRIVLQTNQSLADVLQTNRSLADVLQTNRSLADVLAVAVGMSKGGKLSNAKDGLVL